MDGTMSTVRAGSHTLWRSNPSSVARVIPPVGIWDIFFDFCPVLMCETSDLYTLEVAAESAAPDGIVPFSTPSFSSS